MKIKFGDTAKAEIAAFMIDQDGALPAEAADLDTASGGLLSEAVATGRFSGKASDIAVVIMPKGSAVKRAVLLGAGEPEKRKMGDYETLGARFYKSQAMSGFKTAALYIQDPDAASRVAAGARLAAYRFDSYFTKQTPDDLPSLTTLTLISADTKAARAAFKSIDAAIDGTYFARDLVNEPPNILYPAEFAKRLKALEDIGLEVEILGEKEMTKLGMGSLLGVGQGSAKESKMAIVRWHGGKAGEPPVALVGKGVCFDTGGISLKPPGSMEDMRGDMGGAAAVSGTMVALAKRKAKANVVGLVGLVENMPDGDSIRPGDILTSASGQTIEVQNTDAEGRLVLADVLWYTQEYEKPKAIVDLATLTGAIVVSLGHYHAGLFTAHDEMAEGLSAAGQTTGERVWRLPIGPDYDRLLKSKFADMRNIGGRAAGSITAAQFLKRFVAEDMPWTHLDIAGVAWVEGKKAPTDPSWASGYGPRLLSQWIADQYEG